MLDCTITTTTTTFRPILSEFAISALRHKAELWVAAGKPNICSVENDSELTDAESVSSCNWAEMPFPASASKGGT